MRKITRATSKDATISLKAEESRAGRRGEEIANSDVELKKVS
jgi:hypothetical protein